MATVLSVSTESRKKAALPSSDDQPPVSTLVARLSREDLESLVVCNVQHQGAPLDRKDILALLPESARGTTIAKPKPVTASQARSGTGYFDEIDDEILIPLVLARLSTKQRLECAMVVCKAWRSLREAPELWQDIKVVSVNMIPRGLGTMDGARLQRLIAWLPNPSGVTTLDVSAGDTITPDAIKKVLSWLPSLTALALSGKKITNAVLTHMAKQPACKNLTSLSLSTSGSVHAAEASKLLGMTPRLKELSVSSHLGDENVLSTLARTLRHARNGGCPLLSALSMTTSFGGSVTWSSMSKFGQWFPELESLSVSSLNDHHYGDDPAIMVSGFISRGVAFAVHRLPRLRKLDIHELAGFTANMSSATLEVTFKALLAACPVLEHLSVKHGMMWTGGSQPKPAQPLPTASSCFNELPQSLHLLSLTQITLTSSAFETCTLPELRSLRFESCGSAAQAIVSSLLSTCPKLHPANAKALDGHGLRR